MIKVNFDGPATEPALTEWRDWQQRAETAAKELLRKAKAGEPFEISETLYKEMRNEIFRGFHGKCAYCEAKFVLDQRGDVDHFRPKGRITDDHNKPLRISDGAGGERNHPGYFWLAYDWKNLLPACSRCNRPGKYDDATGTTRQIGKWDRFPVRDGKYAYTPEDIIHEKPLLLNPLEVEPKDHFEFDPATGRLIPKTLEAKECDRILDLNREGLPEARRDMYYAVLTRAGAVKQTTSAQDITSLNHHLGFLQEHKNGAAEYSVAGRRALEDFGPEIRTSMAVLVKLLNLL